MMHSFRITRRSYFIFKWKIAIFWEHKSIEVKLKFNGKIFLIVHFFQNRLLDFRVTWRKIINQMRSNSRVDVSETFSADQLWFRILSCLFQRCSLPENLWTALIQLWTALKTEIFRAKNQRWTVLILYQTALIHNRPALIFSERALFSSDFWIIQDDSYSFIFHFLKIFLRTSIPRHISLVFSPVYEKKSVTKFTCPFSYRPKI